MLRPSGAPVNNKGKLLECKKAYPKRKQNMLQRKIRAEYQVDVFKKEIIVLKVKQKSQIQQKTA